MVQSNFKLENKEPIHGRSYVYDLHYHLVWVTKYREKAFNEQIRKALKVKIKEIADSRDYTIEAIEVMPNHVHVLLSAKPRVAITVIMKTLKGITGKWLFNTYPDEMNKHFWHGHVWSHSYYVGSVGSTTEAIIKHYIDTQHERPFK